jgi:hypothetical protein
MSAPALPAETPAPSAQRLASMSTKEKNAGTRRRQQRSKVGELTTDSRLRQIREGGENGMKGKGSRD